MAYIVANETFKTKSDITDRCRTILAATPDGQSVDELSASFLLHLFRYHDEWPEKSAGGVVHISTLKTPHGSRCFVLVKNDGQRIDISFPHAIGCIKTSQSGKLIPQQLKDFKAAAREAIKIQINHFRDSALQQNLQCVITGESLNRINCAVDHVTPKTFDQLLFDFCRAHSINPLQVDIGSEGGTVAFIKDVDILTAWQEYHEECAILRLISKAGNLSLTKVSVPWSDLLS
ncbi:DUF3223 domain-containing protein [Acidithiobacillus thiooxidans]|uniref:DUF3223 domain-containing protein n=1 Tax=Acidithiobacillus thiooxidans TaxID=930 RepID=UPI0004E0BE83|nr:DUF3223 domain-containing protein [Acidithiobacillus thiooxidans]